MSTECRELVALIGALGAALAVWGVRPAWSAWRVNRRLRREFRRQLARFDSRHVDAWHGSGRDSPQ